MDSFTQSDHELGKWPWVLVSRMLAVTEQDKVKRVDLDGNFAVPLKQRPHYDVRIIQLENSMSNLDNNSPQAQV